MAEPGSRQGHRPARSLFDGVSTARFDRKAASIAVLATVTLFSIVSFVLVLEKFEIRMTSYADDAVEATLVKPPPIPHPPPPSPTKPEPPPPPPPAPPPQVHIPPPPPEPVPSIPVVITPSPGTDPGSTSTRGSPGGVAGGSGNGNGRGGGAPPPPQLKITNPDWLRKPTPTEFSQYYPAKSTKVQAKVRLGCQVTADGRLVNCQVQSENPAGLGFGDAAIRMSAFFQMKPATANGTPVGGAQYTFDLNFVPSV